MSGKTRRTRSRPPRFVLHVLPWTDDDLHELVLAFNRILARRVRITPARGSKR